ncbi:MAG: LuxR C-terminal-related transcriptional regulator [Acidimicrobiales bacterium]
MPESQTPEKSRRATATARPSFHVFDQRAVSPAATTSEKELRAVLDRLPVPIAIWNPDGGSLLLANEAAAEVADIPLSELVGMSAVDIVGPEQKVTLANKSLAEGAIDSYRARRILTSHEGETLYAWVRAIEVDGRRLAVGVFALARDVVNFGGADPTSPFGQSIAVAVGFVDLDWRIIEISGDLSEIIDLRPEDARGRLLFDLLAPTDARHASAVVQSKPSDVLSLFPVVTSDEFGEGVDVCLLIGAPCGSGKSRRLFALVGLVQATLASQTARERELEARLRRISAEVRAAGLIDTLSALEGFEPDVAGESLTTRQLEIVELLIRGERVPSIARRLFISASTVRNHLTHIYARYGVHSQSELLDKLRSKPKIDN